MIRSTVSIPRDTALGEDVSTNTFFFKHLGDPLNVTPAELDSITEALRRLYDVPAPPSAERVSLYFSTLNQSPATVRHYVVPPPGSPAGVPLRTDAMVLTFPASTPAPEEVAIAMSYRETPVPGVNIKRRRGRIFLGPLSITPWASDGTRIRITEVARLAIARSGARFANEIANIGPGWRWVVYSRADNLGYTVQQVYVDNALDTIRSRGGAPTDRSLVPTNIQ